MKIDEDAIPLKKPKIEVQSGTGGDKTPQISVNVNVNFKQLSLFKNKLNY